MSSARNLGFLLAFVIVCCVNGFFTNDSPCDLDVPVHEGGFDNVKLNVPGQCSNGTIRWDYPRGHVTVTFPNPHGVPMHVCLQDFIAGEIFKFNDVTGHQMTPMSSLIRDGATHSCTETHDLDLNLRIAAPVTQYYMGQMTYDVFRQ